MSNLWNWAAKDVFGLGKGRGKPGSKGRTDYYYGVQGKPDAAAKKPAMTTGKPAKLASGASQLLGGG